MRSAAREISVVVAVAFVTACGGSATVSGPTAFSPPTVSLTPPKADITVTFGLDAVTGPSLDPAYGSYIRFTATLRESAGLGAHLDYVRGEFFSSGVLAERYEVGATALVAQSGTNRLEAHSSRSLTITLRRSAPCDLMRVTFRFTDDKGNEHHLVGDIGPGATAVAASPDGSGAPRL